ncbi:tetratricopeptide repeat protein [Microterricola pindariensis]
MKGRTAALLMAALLALYIVLIGWRAVQFVMTGEPIAVGIGIALIVLPLVGAWALGRELLFGVRSQRLVGVLEAEGALPEEVLPTRASGRPLRDAADEDFGRFQAEVEAAPEDWRAWFRLGLAYDASGDRRRARKAIIHAIALERSAH